jgi:Domain of unknown function (DUF4136)
MRNSIRALTLCAAGLLAACASGPKIRADKDPAADMSAYKTFAFFDSPATDQARYATLTTSRLKLTTRLQLEQLGYRYDERNPDLRVNFLLSVANKQELRSSGRAFSNTVWGRFPDQLETWDYKAGTLSIDLVDTRTHSLVWQGVAEGRIGEQALRNQPQTIDAVVRDIFSSFPKA